jgi:simple sugar transport system permease protein
METSMILIGLAGVIAAATPIVFATIGETITEKAGVINLSLNGTIILSAMVGFAVATTSSNLILGFAAGALVGAIVAALIAFASITLKQSQVAVGFVLTLMTRDLAYFLGHPYMGLSGPRVPPGFEIPLLGKIPIIGPLFFNQDILVYLSYFLIVAAFIWIYKSKPGLVLQGIGERPASAYIRGANVNKLRYFYTILGGALVGLAGPMFSLSVKAGWKGTISGLDGLGWIVLAIVIFGGWNPVRATLGAYLFALLQWLSLVLQTSLPGIPSQVLQVAPFPLMILTLLLVNIGNTEWIERTLMAFPEKTRHAVSKILRSMRTNPPASLGVPFENE